MKTLKNFTQKLNLNSSKVANLSHMHTLKGGLAAPQSTACSDAQNRAARTFLTVCGNDTVDTQ